MAAFEITDIEFRVIRAIARAVISEHKAALAEAGYVIVPREPTEAMKLVGRDSIYGIGQTSAERVVDVWRTMIDAAPKDQP